MSVEPLYKLISLSIQTLVNLCRQGNHISQAVVKLTH